MPLLLFCPPPSFRLPSSSHALVIASILFASGLAEVLRDHKYVGAVGLSRILLQHQTLLYLVDLRELLSVARRGVGWCLSGDKTKGRGGGEVDSR